MAEKPAKPTQLLQANPMRFQSWLVSSVAILVFAQASFAQPVPDPSIIDDNVILRIDDGDFTHPTFSPDGKRLAYTRVIIDEHTELTELYVYEFASGKTWRLLDSTDSLDYATYAAYIHSLDWVSNDRVVASVSDGDVDTTLIEFDVVTRNIINTRDGNGEIAWYEKINKWMRSVAKLPAWEPGVLQNAFENGVRLQDGSFLIQPHYSGVDSNVYQITAEGRLTQIAPANGDTTRALAGALQLNDTLLFMLGESSGGNSRRADLLRYDNGKIERLTSIATMTEPQLKPLYIDQERALFFVSTGRSYEQSPGFLYEYSSAGLKDWPAPGPLYDIEVSDDNRMLALVFWQSERRVIEVRDIGKKNSPN